MDELGKAVSPPSAQWTRWWPSHQAPGRSQPGMAQASSRRVRAPRTPRGDAAGGPPDVEGLPGGTEDGGQDRRVASDPPGRLGADRLAAGEPAGRADPPDEGVEVDGDVSVGRRPPAAPGAAAPARQPNSTRASARRRAAPVRLPHSGAVLRRVGGAGGCGCGERVENGGDLGPALPVEPAQCRTMPSAATTAVSSRRDRSRIARSSPSGAVVSVSVSASAARRSSSESSTAA